MPSKTLKHPHTIDHNALSFRSSPLLLPIYSYLQFITISNPCPHPSLPLRYSGLSDPGSYTLQSFDPYLVKTLCSFPTTAWDGKHCCMTQSSEFLASVVPPILWIESPSQVSSLMIIQVTVLSQPSTVCPFPSSNTEAWFPFMKNKIMLCDHELPQLPTCSSTYPSQLHIFLYPCITLYLYHWSNPS